MHTIYLARKKAKGLICIADGCEFSKVSVAAVQRCFAVKHTNAANAVLVLYEIAPCGQFLA